MIKYRTNQVWIGVACLILVLMSVLAILLFWEYRFFCVQSRKMVALQQQYYSYVDEVKYLLRRYKKFDDFESNGDQERTMCGLDTTTFPEGARIVSSEEDDEMLNDSFMVINRAPEYLKESTLAYLKEQQLESLLKNINVHEWQDYTDQVLLSNEPHTRIQSKTPSGRRRKPQAYRLPTKGQRALHGLQLAWPIERSRFWLSSLYGPRKKRNGSGGFHYGIDMAAPRGTPVRAAAVGVVEQAQYVSGYGNMVLVAHDARYKTRYAHLDTICVKPKQRVQKGTKIGGVGDTGFTIKSGKDASHLHFEVHERGKQVNPLYLLAS